jgi:hypothetical protein
MLMLPDDGSSRREDDPNNHHDPWRMRIYVLQAIAAVAATIVAVSQVLR